MSDHTPTTEAMKELAVWAACQQAPDHLRPAQASSEARRIWESWLEAHDKQVAAKALADAAADPRIVGTEAQGWLHFIAAELLSEPSTPEQEGNRG